MKKQQFLTMKELKELKKKFHELHVLMIHTDVSKVNDIVPQLATCNL